jgi:general secretion pathway protein F
MPLFEYSALTDKGKTVTGIIDCDNAQAARQKLRSSRLYPVKVGEVSDRTLTAGRFNLSRLTSLFNRVQPRDLTLATRQMATLVSAGFTLVAAIDTLIQLVEAPRLKQTFSRVKDSI